MPQKMTDRDGRIVSFGTVMDEICRQKGFDRPTMAKLTGADESVLHEWGDGVVDPLATFFEPKTHALLKNILTIVEKDIVEIPMIAVSAVLPDENGLSQSLSECVRDNLTRTGAWAPLPPFGASFPSNN